ncbi:hypothetical protein M8C21_023898, partial [Ambrosia artemisiifolia]
VYDNICFHLHLLENLLFSTTKCEFVPIYRKSYKFQGVYFFHWKGDYYRYLAEFKTGYDKKEAADQSLKAYQVSL